MIYYPNYNKKNLHNFILNLFFHTIILSRSIYDKKGLHWCWNTNKIPLNQSVISQKTRIENDSKKTRMRVQANKRNGKAGRRGEGRDAYCKKAKWMSIGTVWEKSWVTGCTSGTMQLAPDCTCLMDQIGNRLSRFLFVLFAPFPFSTFLRCQFPLLPAVPQWRCTRDRTICLPLASQGQDPCKKQHENNARSEV